MAIYSVFYSILAHSATAIDSYDSRSLEVQARLSLFAKIVSIESLMPDNVSYSQDREY